MKKFKELSAIFPKEERSKILLFLSSTKEQNWVGSSREDFRTFIYLDYKETASVCLLLEMTRFKVVNIVPLEKTELTIDEYNSILDKFYEEICIPMISKFKIEFSLDKTDIFNPLDVMSNEALKKLELFCDCANKSTGSSHPCDQERWYNFIIQTVHDNRIISTGTLIDFLQDKSYWKKGSGHVIERSAWSEDMAYKLGLEYEQLADFLSYYAKNY